MDENYELESEEELSEKKKKGKIKRQRNLPQYKNLSDDAFSKIMEEKSLTMGISEDFEKKIQKKLAEFEEDYDLSDLKINDRDTLRALIQAHLSLEYYEQKMFVVRSGDMSDSTMYVIEKLSKVMSDLRADIAKFQTELNISRKVRKSDQDVSVLAYIDGLKSKAKTFYESKMSYIFCPKCNILLGTFWTLYPEEERNKIALVCGRVLEDGSKCSEKIVIGTKELIKNRGTSNKAIIPESML